MGRTPESLSPIDEEWGLGLTSAHMSFHVLSSFERASTMRTFAGPRNRLGSPSALRWRHWLPLLSVAAGQHLHEGGAPGQLERCWRWKRDPGCDVGSGLGASWFLEAKPASGVGVGARTALNQSESCCESQASVDLCLSMNGQADAVLFLCSTQASCVQGDAIVVDIGYTVNSHWRMSLIVSNGGIS